MSFRLSISCLLSSIKSWIDCCRKRWFTASLICSRAFLFSCSPNVHFNLRTVQCIKDCFLPKLKIPFGKKRACELFTKCTIIQHWRHLPTYKSSLAFFSIVFDFLYSIVFYPFLWIFSCFSIQIKAKWFILKSMNNFRGKIIQSIWRTMLNI